MRVLALAFLAAAMATPASAEPSLVTQATAYVSAQQAVMEKAATAADVERLMSFYAPGYTYYHPQFGAKVTGLDNVRSGASSHLGETADAAIQIKGVMLNGNMVVLSLEERFTDVATGQRIDRPRTTVLTFDQGKIVQRVDM